MICPLAPLSGSTADTDIRVVPGVAPSRILSVKNVAPKGRNRGALSLTSNTFTVSFAARDKRQRKEMGGKELKTPDPYPA